MDLHALFLYTGLYFLLYRVLVVGLNLLQETTIPIKETVEHRPNISLLIPARNEAHNLPTLFKQLEHIEDQVNEIILLDDESTDGTGKMASAYFEKRKGLSSKYQVIIGEGPPAGWLGKNYACHCLAKAAKGDYFLFLDADIAQLDKRFIPSLFSQIKKNRLQLLSVFPDQYILSKGEQLIVPLMHYLLLSLLPLRWILTVPFPSMAAANGQCMLFEAEAYQTHHWHEKVKGTIVEDIAIMRKVKKARLRGLALTANGLIHTRMYQNLQEAVAGFGKNILAGFRNNIPGLLLYLVVLLIWPLWICYLVLLGEVPGYVILLLAGALLFIRIGVSRLAGQSSTRNCIFHPAQMTGLLFISLRSISNRILKRNTWKGRNVQL